ncbi:MAG: aminoacetone oxidase family FAD-binding enzyme [Planctomycetes bacterium]|nr:aminoacetone oxidase family FAD-binding enzyme [Planctomycetota bacterium]
MSTSPDPIHKLNSASTVVIGAGAAGLVAAIFAAREGVPTVLLEGTEKIGTKILISGGGRCNVLPGAYDEQAFFTQGSRNILRRIFRTWPHTEIRAWFEGELGVPLKLETESGKLFPVSEKARTVRDALVEACLTAGVEIRTGWRVERVEAPKGLDQWIVHAQAESHAPLQADCVVLATGGQSVPKTGSDGHGYSMARAMGHSTLPIYPALAPLRHAEDDLLTLAGVSVPISWSTWKDGKCLERGMRPALFTHQGLSGPAILDASHWVIRDGAELRIGWGGMNREAWADVLCTSSARTLGICLQEHLPKRLAQTLLTRAHLSDQQSFAQFTRQARERLLNSLGNFALPVTGDRGFAVAEVTGGGIPLGEVRPSTLESRKQKKLYLCGEILDCIGRIGGHNFLWAWVTGRLAGTQAAKKART